MAIHKMLFIVDLPPHFRKAVIPWGDNMWECCPYESLLPHKLILPEAGTKGLSLWKLE